MDSLMCEEALTNIVDPYEMSHKCGISSWSSLFAKARIKESSVYTDIHIL